LHDGFGFNKKMICCVDDAKLMRNQCELIRWGQMQVDAKHKFENMSTETNLRRSKIEIWQRAFKGKEGNKSWPIWGII